MASNLKVDIVRPTATNGSLSLKGDSGGSATTNGVTVNSSGNTSITGTTTVSSLVATTDATINGLTVGRGSGDVATNTATGSSALASNTNGIENTAHGSAALYANTNGNYNTAYGRAALYSNTDGVQNTACGRSALYANTTGTNNVAIGVSSGNDGLVAITTQSNNVVLGNNSTTHLYCKTSTITTSDIRDKNITGVVNHGLEFIKQLNPIRFFFKKSREEPENHGPERYGFSAQEILELEGDDPIIIDNSNQDSLKIASNYLIPVLVNAIKEQQEQIDALTTRLDAAGL